MMGEHRVIQESLFYEFQLESHIPPDHPLRHIEGRSKATMSKELAMGKPSAQALMRS